MWSADVAIETVGRPEYFRVGFHEGMSEAFGDSRIGYRDRTEGERLGWHDAVTLDIDLLGTGGVRIVVELSARSTQRSKVTSTSFQPES